jgi:hypothetical protein
MLFVAILTVIAVVFLFHQRSPRSGTVDLDHGNHGLEVYATHLVVPDYPSDESSKQLGGLVVLAVHFAADGSRRDIEVLQETNRNFGRASVVAANRSAFKVPNSVPYSGSFGKLYFYFRCKANLCYVETPH